MGSPRQPSTRLLSKAESLIIANAISLAGDVLFAFLWNARLILSAPSAGLVALGLSSVIGAAVGLGLGFKIAKLNNQAPILGVCAAVRAVVIAVVGLAALLNVSWVLPLSIIAQIGDVCVAVLTAGATLTLVSGKVSKDRFVRVLGFNQWLNRAAVSTAWLIGGVILSVWGAAVLLLIDFISFLPIIFLLFYWARYSRGLPLVKIGSRPSSETRQKLPMFASLHALIAIFGLIMLLGGLISRTTPLLWQSLFGLHTLFDVPDDIMLGLLFAVFSVGSILGAFVIANGLVASVIERHVDRWELLACVIGIMGVLVGTLVVAGLHPVVFVSDLAVLGFVNGMFYPMYVGKLRNVFEGSQLKQAFYYVDLLARFGDPLGSGAAGLFLLFMGVRGLYLICCLGLVVVAVLLLRPALHTPDPALNKSAEAYNL